MGVAGVAMMYGFYSFFMLIRALSKWLSWKNKGVLCPAVIVETNNVNTNYKNKKDLTQYQYTVAVDYKDTQPMTVYPLAQFNVVVDANLRNDIAVGKELKLLYNPKTGICADPKELQSNITTHLGTLVLCIIIFFVCCLIAEAL